MAGQCMCGWVRDEAGRLFEKNTGRYEGFEKKGKKKPPAWARKLIGKPCYYCGKTANTKDHVIPKSRGGLNTKDNIVPACEHCNNMKGSRTEEEFRAYTEQLMWLEYEREREHKLQYPIQFGWVKVPA